MLADLLSSLPFCSLPYIVDFRRYSVLFFLPVPAMALWICYNFFSSCGVAESGAALFLVKISTCIIWTGTHKKLEGILFHLLQLLPLLH
jgi:hypothetical protein